MADRRRRRRRASQDSEEEGEEESGSDSTGVERAVQPGRTEGRELGNRRVEATTTTTTAAAVRDGKESECESEDGIEGDAVLTDYESAEESEEEEEARFSEDDALKTTLKSENNASETPAQKEEKPKSKGAVTGERQSGDGQESTEPEENKTTTKSQKQLDDDEDRKNPAYIPRKGLFFEHDLRGHTNDEEVRPKGRHPRKLWKDEGRWEHDRFREDEQAPKSRDELIAMYGYDIRSCKNSEAIHPRRPRKPRYSSPQREDEDEKPNRPSNRYQESNSAPPPRTYNNRSTPNNGRAPPNRTYSRPGYKENRPASYPPEDGATPHSTSERRQEYGGYRGRSTEQTPSQPSESSTEVQIKTEPAADKQVEDPSPPPPDRPVEKKSYSRARRIRVKGGEAGKSIDDTTFPDLPPPPPPQIPTEVVPVPSPPIPVVKPGGWEPPVEGSVTGLEQDLSQVNISDQNWSPGQSTYIPARGIPNHIHMAGGPPQYNRLEGMSGRVKRYSSQRQRQVPDPAPMHISLMEGHYYDPLQFQGPVYTHGENPPSIPPQGMIVPQEMHLPHPGLHPHPPAAPMSTPNLYPGPVSIPPGQPPPQQLLPPPYFTAPPSVINFGTPTYPYPPGALPPPPPPTHLYPNTQAQSQVFGGVTYYNPVHQQVQPKPSPPRRTSQPVTIKPPPPEENRHLKAKEKSSS
ncbi:protein CASC3 isoform X2 [Bufo gargarizans]|uniref:protein CASC3 isoform X2 n=1 Tax=Bufo gargarizans TaxID=30331 RepID=UPI001CF532DA|nr:protein CASC3 isoform X2 [Bufo gargarizans]